MFSGGWFSIRKPTRKGSLGEKKRCISRSIKGKRQCKKVRSQKGKGDVRVSLAYPIHIIFRPFAKNYFLIASFYLFLCRILKHQLKTGLLLSHLVPNAAGSMLKSQISNLKKISMIFQSPMETNQGIRIYLQMVKM